MDQLYGNEIFVYQAVDSDIYPVYSVDGFEFPISEDEKKKIRELDHVLEVYDNVLLMQGGLIYLPEEVEYYQQLENDMGLIRRKITLLDADSQILSENSYPLEDIPNGGYSLSMGTYLDDGNYSDDIEIQTQIKDGVYLTHSLAEQMGLDLKENDELYLEMNFSIPQYIAYNDAFIGYGEENEELIPCCEVKGKTIRLKFPVSGVLKGGTMGANFGQDTGFFLSYSYLWSLIEEYRVTESIDYVSTDAGYVLREKAPEAEGRMMHCEPYQANSLIVTVDSASNKQTVIKSLEKLGYRVSSQYSQVYAAQFSNNMESNLFLLSITALIMLAIIYFVMQFLNLKEEMNFINFFEQLGFSKKNAKQLCLKKYMNEWLSHSLLCLLFSFIYFKICQRLAYFPMAATYAFIPIIFILSFVILFVYPMLILLIGGRKS